jgi:hypothetical protein
MNPEYFQPSPHLLVPQGQGCVDPPDWDGRENSALDLFGKFHYERLPRM